MPKRGKSTQNKRHLVIYHGVVVNQSLKCFEQLLTKCFVSTVDNLGNGNCGVSFKYIHGCVKKHGTHHVPKSSLRQNLKVQNPVIFQCPKSSMGPNLRTDPRSTNQPTSSTSPSDRFFPPNSGSEARILVILDLADSTRKSQVPRRWDGRWIRCFWGDGRSTKLSPGNTHRSLNWLEFSRNVVLEPEKPRKLWFIYRIMVVWSKYAVLPLNFQELVSFSYPTALRLEAFYSMIRNSWENG